jgi:NAD(P)H dehydrogenase (quinone)
LLRERYQSKDVLEQQQKVASAEALAFVAPVHFLSFPAILKGWLDRVWTPGFAYDLTAEAWRGDINGRRPRLTHKKALIIQTTIFDQRAYDAGLRDAMRMVIDEFTLTYPGVQNVEREYFYAVHGADDATRRRYLERAYAPRLPVLRARAHESVPTRVLPEVGPVTTPVRDGIRQRKIRCPSTRRTSVGVQLPMSQT